MPISVLTPSKDEVSKAFKTLDNRQQHLVYYRVLLRRYAQNKNIAFKRREEYDFFMFYILSLESLFLRSKKIRALALALFYKEIEYIKGRGTEESEANLLYVEGLGVEGMGRARF